MLRSFADEIRDASLSTGVCRPIGVLPVCAPGSFDSRCRTPSSPPRATLEWRSGAHRKTIVIPVKS
jgi:hypothetical protein